MYSQKKKDDKVKHILIGDIHAGIDVVGSVLKNHTPMNTATVRTHQWSPGFGISGHVHPPGGMPVKFYSSHQLVWDFETSDGFRTTKARLGKQGSLQIEAKLKEAPFLNQLMGDWLQKHDYAKGVFPADIMGRKRAHEDMGILMDLKLHSELEIRLFKKCDVMSEVMDLLPHINNQALVTYVLKESLDLDVNEKFNKDKYKAFMHQALRKITQMKYLDFLTERCTEGIKNKKNDPFRFAYDHPKPILEIAIMARIKLLKDSPSIRFIMED